MEKKKFPCRLDELPAIGRFVLDSFRKDLADFSGFSIKFSPSYQATAEQKLTECNELVMAGSVTKELKAVTVSLGVSIKKLSLLLNRAEGYVKLVESGLDVDASDMGFKEVRLKINKGDVEGATSFGRELAKSMERNQMVLQSVGMPLQMPSDIAILVQEIFDLNALQNTKISDRGESSDGNMAVYNEFWEIISTIMTTAKALYRGVDDVKLKNYTMTQLIKRVNATGENKKTPDAPKA